MDKPIEDNRNPWMKRIGFFMVIVYFAPSLLKEDLDLTLTFLGLVIGYYILKVFIKTFIKIIGVILAICFLLYLIF